MGTLPPPSRARQRPAERQTYQTSSPSMQSRARKQGGLTRVVVSPIVRLAYGGLPGSRGRAPGHRPADVLAADAGRGLRAAECATLLDGYLRRLARQEARARRVLGTLAHGFLRLRRRHHHDLGFARLRDYTRERLGLSARDCR